MAYGKRAHHLQYRRPSRQSLARRLQAWRKRKDLSQREAALKLQISPRTLQEWEQGRAEPRGFARPALEKAIRA